MNDQPPTLDEFRRTCRNELAFLKGYGFAEVSPPAHRQGSEFELWFNNDKQYVIISGEGWGEYASIMLEHADGLELAEIDLVPEEKRPPVFKKNKRKLSQIEQIHQSATWLREYGADYLKGNLKRFYEHARKLPPYKCTDYYG